MRKIMWTNRLRHLLIACLFHLDVSTLSWDANLTDNDAMFLFPISQMTAFDIVRHIDSIVRRVP